MLFRSVVSATAFEVVLDVCANGQQIQTVERNPVPHGTANAEVCGWGDLIPAANLFRRTLTETDFVHLIPAALSCIASVLSVYTGLKDNLF